MLWALVAAAVIVLASAGVYEFWVVPRAANGGAPAPADLTFDQARAVAEGAVSTYQGGGWSLVLAAGFASANATTLSLNATALTKNLGLSCPLTSVGGHSTDTVFAPRYSGVVTAGIAPLWVVGFRHSDNSLLFVEVENGSGTLVAAIPSGGACGSLFALLTPVPGTVLDSSNASTIANGAGGSAFLAAHPSAKSSFALFGGFSFLGTQLSARWSVAYTICPPPGSASPQMPPQWTFNATIDAVSGHVVYRQTALVSCTLTTGGSGVALSSALILAPPTTATSFGHHWYNLSVAAAYSGVTFGNTTVVIETASGSVVSAAGRGWTFSVLAITGATVGVFNLTTGQWTQGGTTPYASGLELSLGTGATTLPGDVLVLFGDSGYPGSVQVALP